jgi:hypothetical protein
VKTRGGRGQNADENIMELKTHIAVEVELSDAIRMLNDRERISWATALLETIREEGTIGVMRDLVNNSQWDD